MSDMDSANESYRALLERRLQVYLQEERAEKRRSAAANVWSHVLGWPAAIFAGVVSTTIFTDKYDYLAGWCALVIVVLTASNSWWKPQRGAALHEERRLGYHQLVRLIERQLPLIPQMASEDIMGLVEAVDALERQILHGSESQAELNA